ncbi:MAG TPA: transcriptional regulator [Firmicutes bacterium]|nr:transcriptional regulator [Bacillota bacterium]
MADFVYLVTTDALGQGDRALGKKLIGNFFRLLAEQEPLPVAVFLMNAGVKLAAAGSPVINHLRKLEERRVEILSCQTCVNYYGLERDIAVGLVQGMTDLLALAARYRVITIA